LQPINILTKKGVYEKVLLHELLHWVLYGLDEKYQEGLIYWWLREYDRKEVEDFLNVFDGNLHNFIISHWNE
jgi:elongation factor P hydroxylase